jgi:hypothetical protein
VHPIFQNHFFYLAVFRDRKKKHFRSGKRPRTNHQGHRTIKEVRAWKKTKRGKSRSAEATVDRVRKLQLIKEHGLSKGKVLAKVAKAKRKLWTAFPCGITELRGLPPPDPTLFRVRNRRKTEQRQAERQTAESKDKRPGGSGDSQPAEKTDHPPEEWIGQAPQSQSGLSQLDSDLVQAKQDRSPTPDWEGP